MNVKLWGLIFSGLLLSCVSKKKFEANSEKLNSELNSALNWGQMLNKKLDSTQLAFNDLREKTEKEKTYLLSQIDKKTADILEKDQVLQSRAEHLRNLQAQLEAELQQSQRLQEAIQNALIGFSGEEISVELKNGAVYVSLSDQLLFESASAKLNPKGLDALGKLAVALKNQVDVQICIVGHTDSLPIKTTRYKDNWDLSVDRAVSIIRILEEKHGINGSRIKAGGRSWHDPIAPNKEASGRARNRRTEILLSPRLYHLFGTLGTD